MSIVLNGEIDGFLRGSIETIGREPVVNELNVSENGTYTPPSGVDGYSPVIVNVPGPVLQPLSISSNGIYTPPSGVDGYSEVDVNVPVPVPVLQPLSISSNGTYTPPSGVDGYSEVTVNVPVTDKIIDDKKIFWTDVNPESYYYENGEILNNNDLILLSLNFYTIPLTKTYAFIFNGTSWSSGDIDLGGSLQKVVVYNDRIVTTNTYGSWENVNCKLSRFKTDNLIY